jgi:ammonium transporter, Amt family
MMVLSCQKMLMNDVGVPRGLLASLALISSNVFIGLLCILLMFPTGAMAQSSVVSEESQFVFNTLSFLFHGLITSFILLGLGMKMGGSVQRKSMGYTMLQTALVFSVTALMFWLIGYNLMYTNVDGGWMGDVGLWRHRLSDAMVLDGDTSSGYASASDWFFQVILAAIATTIAVSGALERITAQGVLLFAIIFSGGIYPIVGSWIWGRGWLDAMGFSDVAGSSSIHILGGAAALSCLLWIGARRGRFHIDGTPVFMMPASHPLVVLGGFFSVIGLMAFHGGAALALGSPSDSINTANGYINSLIASSSGMITAMVLSMMCWRTLSLGLIVNGAMGAMVAIAAEPFLPSMGISACIGVIAGWLVVLGHYGLRKLRLDDVVDVVPVHLVCGLWGVMAVALSNPNVTVMTQAIGGGSIVGVGVVVGGIVWGIVHLTVGLRISEEIEDMGMDKAVLGGS